MKSDPAARSKGQRTRDNVLLAARAVFGRDGFSGARMSDIAQEAGLSQGAIYRYFRHKDEVFRAVLAEMNDTFFPAARPGHPSRGDFEDSLYEANLHFLDLYWEGRDLMRAFHQAASTEPLYREIWEAMRTRYRQRFLHVLQRRYGVELTRDVELRALAVQCCLEEFAHTNFAARVGPGITPQVTVAEAARVTSAIWSAAFRDIIPSLGAMADGGHPVLAASAGS